MRWLPTQYIINRGKSLVRWIDFGEKCLTEPFFDMTLEYLRASSPPAPERVTSIQSFLDVASTVPTALPAGVIFHVTRCGSTLLANVLKAGELVVTLSEAQPLAPLFETSPFRRAPSLAAVSDNARGTFLDALIRLYAHYGATSVNAKVLIKANPMGIFALSLIRQVWPTVPFVILIRDPVEVIVSNLNQPSGWLLERKHSCEFGWTSTEAENMPPEEYLARFVGRVCQEGIAQLDNKCCVIDYSMLDKQCLSGVADFLGIDIGGAPIEEVLRKDAKDPTNSSIFVADTERKQRDATPLARDCARRWAVEPYRHLRAMASLRLDRARTRFVRP